MYERNAIILERYFNQMFGYDMKSNIKTNFKDYSDLIESLEKYKDVADEEENVMQEYDIIANRIREIQKKQEALSKKNAKYQEEREEIFQNIDESSENIQKKFEHISNNINQIDEQIKENVTNFVNVVAEFNEKSNTRLECGKSRRNIEETYNKNLNKILDNYKNIDIEKEKIAKQFIDMQTEDIEKELKEKIEKNGEKEKIPFNTKVVTRAIALCVDIQKRETEILSGIYEKTNRLFVEIKNNSTKGDRHKKLIKDAKCKLEFVGALKEYLVLFLDNERLTAVNGVEEHNKLMEEACKNLDEDLTQINNLYTLLLKEISKKIAKKSYPELYNIQYLEDLEKKSIEFDNEIKKLNLPVTIINPNYWRIEGMRKIYEVFNKNVTEEYGRDLSEYMPKKVEVIEEVIDDSEDDEKIEEEKEEVVVPKKSNKRKIKNITSEEDSKSEIDKKIDMILGFDNQAEDADDDWDEEDAEDDLNNSDEEDDDEVYYDIWGNDIKDSDSENEEDDDWEDEDSEFDDDDEDEWDDEEDDESDIEEDDDDWDDDEETEEDDDDWDYEDEEDTEDEDDWDDEEEIIDEEDSKKNKKKNKSKDDDDWGNEFINTDEKDKTKKKKSFFDKFRK